MRMSGGRGGGDRKRDSPADSMLSEKPNIGLGLMSHEIMT